MTDIFASGNRFSRDPPAFIQAIPEQASGGPYGFRRLRLPEFLDTQHVKVLRLSAPSTVRLNPQIELTPGPQCGRKDEANENSQ